MDSYPFPISSQGLVHGFLFHVEYLTQQVFVYHFISVLEQMFCWLENWFVFAYIRWPNLTQLNIPIYECTEMDRYKWNDTEIEKL